MADRATGRARDWEPVGGRIGDVARQVRHRDQEQERADDQDPDGQQCGRVRYPYRETVADHDSAPWTRGRAAGASVTSGWPRALGVGRRGRGARDPRQAEDHVHVGLAQVQVALRQRVDAGP